MNGQRDIWEDGRIRTERWEDGKKDREMGGWEEGQRDGRMGRRTERWEDG